MEECFCFPNLLVVLPKVSFYPSELKEKADVLFDLKFPTES
jgi:hypothetical protein